MASGQRGTSMPHAIMLISTIAIGFALAFLFGFFGFIAARLGLSPLVGYLVAGVAIGPFTPGFVADRAITGQLAEIGTQEQQAYWINLYNALTV
jgi:CPA2 family monovalent cation:H+ antiporter-2